MMVMLMRSMPILMDGISVHRKQHIGYLVSLSITDLSLFFDYLFICLVNVVVHLQKLKQLKELSGKRRTKSAILKLFFLLNSQDPNAQQYTYDEIPQFYVWNETDRRLLGPEVS